ncbi:hypothetical protein OG946_29965 [Streptomyces sp. NBC_01808]|nr:hypothetical protein OG946_29965 [Streptomyces sp. NBC_01808]
MNLVVNGDAETGPGGTGIDVYDVTPERFTAHMRVIGDRRDPDSPVTTLTTFHVDRGTTGSYEDEATKNSPAQYRRD